MKNILVCALSFLLTLVTLPGAGQGHKVQFLLNAATFSSVIPTFNDSAQKALRIESEVLSSQEFKDSLLAHTFTCRNYPASLCGCHNNNLDCTKRIPGATVYDSLMKKSLVTLTLIIEKANIWTRYKSHSYGHSCPCSLETTSYTWWLQNDDLEYTQHYAAHLAHEYTHIVGYLHGNFKLSDDAPYVVGNIVEHILLRRKQVQARVNEGK